jgi:CO/xanthine dehydrogenase FAD-binding subunit
MYHRPKSLEEALDTLGRGGGRILAGGTDVFPALDGPRLDEAIVDLSRIDSLRGIATVANDIRIGARTTWTDILKADLPRGFGGLKAAAREVGSVQIQNVGTVGGNLCNASPAADGIPPLLALDAAVELVSPVERRVLPLEKFLVGYRATALRPDEILAAILVPQSFASARVAFLKLGARRYLVISIAMIAVSLDVDAAGRVAAARVAVGACSVVAQRLRSLEADLIGARADASLAAVAEPHHLNAISPIDDMRASAAYRRDAALTLVRRALAAAAAEP